MAVGSVIIAPDCPNIREILSNETAIFFTKSEQASFITQLNKTIEDINCFDELRIAVKNSVIEKGFVWQENAKRVVDLACTEIGKQK
jgi:hypothetical protein